MLTTSIDREIRMNDKPDSSLVATNCQPHPRSQSLRAKLCQTLCAVLVATAVATPVGAAETDPATARMRMVDEQLRAEASGITSPAVLKAMATVPRHKLKPYAYEDRPLPIGHGQTISQPYVVAFMTEKQQEQASDRVLEIGTGSGYQAAILSGLVSAEIGDTGLSIHHQRTKRKLVSPIAPSVQATVGLDV